MTGYDSYADCLHAYHLEVATQKRVQRRIAKLQDTLYAATRRADKLLEQLHTEYPDQTMQEKTLCPK